MKRTLHLLFKVPDKIKLEYDGFDDAEFAAMFEAIAYAYYDYISDEIHIILPNMYKKTKRRMDVFIPHLVKAITHEQIHRDINTFLNQDLVRKFDAIADQTIKSTEVLK